MKRAAAGSRGILCAALRRGWPDEARVIAQRPALAKVIGASRGLRGRCLNAGAGEGAYAGFLEEAGAAEIVHVDLTPTPPIRPGVSVHRRVVASLTALPFRNDTFDCSLCTEVLEHIDDDHLAVRELGRVLRPGGVLLLSVPTPPSPDDPAHVRNGYTVAELRQLFEAARLAVVRQAYCLRLAMRALMRVWRYGASRGRGRHPYLPSAVVRAVGHLDRHLPIGRPWDLVVLAVKADA